LPRYIVAVAVLPGWRRWLRIRVGASQPFPPVPEHDSSEETGYIRYRADVRREIDVDVLAVLLIRRK